MIKDTNAVFINGISIQSEKPTSNNILIYDLDLNQWVFKKLSTSIKGRPNSVSN